MNTENIIAQIDAEIATLERAKLLLSGGEQPKKSPGRPRKEAVATVIAPIPKRKKMSAAARARISAAQKTRWAKQLSTKPSKAA